MGATARKRNKTGSATATRDLRIVRPQPGPQELFARTPADIGILGGSVFGGKTWSLVLEPVRHLGVKDFDFVLFRREMPEITNPGGLWDETQKWYPDLGGVAREHPRHEWRFPAGSRGMLSGLQANKDCENWKGAQVCLFLFDQLELFTGYQFWYMLSRNRSTCGVRPYMRASCNPDPDCFLADLLKWWIDQDEKVDGEQNPRHGYAIPERSGAIRWFLRINDTIEWSDTVCLAEQYDDFEAFNKAALAEMVERFGDDAGGPEGGPPDGRFVRSLTFILARLKDNVIGNTLDPQYEGNVRALPLVERQRLLGDKDLGGNWKVRPSAGKVFNRGWFNTVDAVPHDIEIVRYWDKADTDEDEAQQYQGAMSAGVKMGYSRSQRRYVILDATFGYWSAGQRENVIKQVAQADGPGCTVVIEQEPGSAGKEVANNTIKNLPGYTVRKDKATGDKFERAGPMSAQAEAGNITLLRGEWNEEALQQLHRFAPGRKVIDVADAAVGAFNWLNKGVTDTPDMGNLGGGDALVRESHWRM